MAGHDSKSKKDNSAVRAATSPPNAITTGKDMALDQSEKTTVTTDLPSSFNTSPGLENRVQPQDYLMDRSLDEAKENVITEET